jgi:hypothetical protein
MKIGDRVITYAGDKGVIVTEPTLIFRNICYGIVFDNTKLNEKFNPYYVSADLLLKIKKTY